MHASAERALVLPTDSRAQDLIQYSHQGQASSVEARGRELLPEALTSGMSDEGSPAPAARSRPSLARDGAGGKRSGTDSAPQAARPELAFARSLRAPQPARPSWVCPLWGTPGGLAASITPLHASALPESVLF